MRDIWQRTSVEDDGITITTYHEAGGIARIEDETHWTWSELAELLADNSEFHVSTMDSMLISMLFGVAFAHICWAVARTEVIGGG